MQSVSMPPSERARKIASLVLQRVTRDASQVAIAAAIGVSESTISRMLAPEHLDKVALMLAHAGLKVVAVEAICVDRRMYERVRLHAELCRQAVAAGNASNTNGASLWAHACELVPMPGWVAA